MKVALYGPRPLGGVSTIVAKLQKGLIKEGIIADIILSFKSQLVPIRIYEDIKNINILKKYDLIIIYGSIPWPSHIFLRMRLPIVLFVHGFIYHELLSAIRRKLKLGTIFLLSLTIKKAVDLYICHSVTTCEANKIFSNFVLLPQWVFSEELEVSPKNVYLSDRVRIVTYTSYARSPRLLSHEALITIIQLLKLYVKKKFELIIIDPLSDKDIYINSYIKIIRPLPRREFLELIAASHLYIERSIDEELRLASLEAMALGTPVAKLTHPRFWPRQDYEDSVIVGSTLRGLVMKLADYVNNIDFYYPYYSRKARDYVSTRRTWDTVKKPFLNAMMELLEQYK